MNLFRRIFGGKDAGAHPPVLPASVERRSSAPLDDGAPRLFEIPSRRHFGECTRSKNGGFLLTWADIQRRLLYLGSQGLFKGMVRWAVCRGHKCLLLGRHRRLVGQIRELGGPIDLASGY